MHSVIHTIEHSFGVFVPLKREKEWTFVRQFSLYVFCNKQSQLIRLTDSNTKVCHLNPISHTKKRLTLGTNANEINTKNMYMPNMSPNARQET